jgi:hypothetical protein
VVQGHRSVELAAFRCGPTLIEFIRPIDHPQIDQFLWGMVRGSTTWPSP